MHEQSALLPSSTTSAMSQHLGTGLLTLAIGAKQLVVQEALDTTSMVLLSYLSLFTPITNMGASLDGALMTTCMR